MQILRSDSLNQKLSGNQQSVFLTALQWILRTTALKRQSQGWGEAGKENTGEREKWEDVRLDSFMEEQHGESLVVELK